MCRVLFGPMFLSLGPNLTRVLCLIVIFSYSVLFCSDQARLQRCQIAGISDASYNRKLIRGEVVDGKSVAKHSGGRGGGRN